MSSSQVQEYYDFVYELVISAGAILRNGYVGTKVINTKEGLHDLVTQYDLQIEQFLVQKITEKYPNHKFIGEETAFRVKSINGLTDDPTWIIDPIDGTSNFIKNIPITCVSIGLAVNKELVMGIVFNPIYHEIYTARKGQGAYLNGHRIRSSDCSELKRAICAYETSLNHPPKLPYKHGRRFFFLSMDSMGTRSFGSAALSLCYVASGSLDAYAIEGLYPWDFAAAVVIAREAGAVVYNSSGGEFDVMNPNIVCAGTEALAQEIIASLRKGDEMHLPDID